MDEKKKKMILNAVLQLKYGETVVMDHDRLGDNLSYKASLVASMLDSIETETAIIKDECGEIVKIIF